MGHANISADARYTGPISEKEQPSDRRTPILLYVAVHCNARKMKGISILMLPCADNRLGQPGRMKEGSEGGSMRDDLFPGLLVHQCHYCHSIDTERSGHCWTDTHAHTHWLLVALGILSSVQNFGRCCCESFHPLRNDCTSEKLSVYTLTVVVLNVSKCKVFFRLVFRFVCVAQWSNEQSKNALIAPLYGAVTTIAAEILTAK